MTLYAFPRLADRVSNESFNSRRFDEAAAYCKKLIEDHPGDPDFRHVFALILDAQGKRHEAEEQSQIALQIDPKHTKSQLMLIEVFQREGEMTRPLQVAHAWSLADPNSAEAQKQAADLSSENGEYKAAVEHYRNAMELDPDLVGARSNYFQTMVRLGRIGEAIQVLSEELRNDPDIRVGHSLLGLALDVAGRRKEAVLVFMAGLEREPNNGKILRELAWIKATAKDAQWRNGPEALVFAKRAVELAPNDPDFLQVLAAAYAENSQFDDAIDFALRAIRLADANNNQGLSEFIRRCLPAYESRQPIRVQ